jgi:hypothetical protein
MCRKPAAQVGEEKTGVEITLTTMKHIRITQKFVSYVNNTT